MKYYTSTQTSKPVEIKKNCWKSVRKLLAVTKDYFEMYFQKEENQWL